MFKKIILSMIIITILLAGTAAPYAVGITPESIITDKNIESTDQFIVTITRPEGDETTFNKSYVICGISNIPDVRVALSRYNEEKGVYEDFLTTDGVSSWDAGSLFTKEVILAEGANKIKLVAYKNYEVQNLVVGTNAQVNKFTITVLKESLKDILINGMLRITDIIQGIMP